MQRAHRFHVVHIVGLRTEWAAGRQQHFVQAQRAVGQAHQCGAAEPVAHAFAVFGGQDVGHFDLVQVHIRVPCQHLDHLRTLVEHAPFGDQCMQLLQQAPLHAGGLALGGRHGLDGQCQTPRKQRRHLGQHDRAGIGADQKTFGTQGRGVGQVAVLQRAHHAVVEQRQHHIQPVAAFLLQRAVGGGVVPGLTHIVQAQDAGLRIQPVPRCAGGVVGIEGFRAEHAAAEAVPGCATLGAGRVRPGRGHRSCRGRAQECGVGIGPRIGQARRERVACRGLSQPLACQTQAPHHRADHDAAKDPGQQPAGCRLSGR